MKKTNSPPLSLNVKGNTYVEAVASKDGRSELIFVKKNSYQKIKKDFESQRSTHYNDNDNEIRLPYHDFFDNECLYDDSIGIR